MQGQQRGRGSSRVVVVVVVVVLVVVIAAGLLLRCMPTAWTTVSAPVST